MIKHLNQNRIAAVGLLACVILGGFEFFEAYLGGISRLDLNTPLGAMADASARMFTSSSSGFALDAHQQVLAYHFLWIGRLVSALLFGALSYHLSFRSKAPSRHRSPHQVHGIFLVQLFVGLSGLSSLLCVLAAEFCLVLGWRKAWPWLIAQMSLYTGIYLYYLFGRGAAYNQDAMEVALFYLFAQLLLYAIFFFATLGWMRARSRSLALNAAHAELLATQAMLTDTVSANERLRISRDLHDAIGHHLTALNLHLDLAQRQVASISSISSISSNSSNSANNFGDLQNSLAISRELASGLLSEIRGIVSLERQQQKIDLAYALETLCAGIPQLAIRLELDKTLEINSAVIAHALFCCIQEAITNCVRHAAASVLHISLRKMEQTILVVIEDNGAGRHTETENNGLRGMRERISQLPGQLSFTNSTEGGFRLTMTIPLQEAKELM